MFMSEICHCAGIACLMIATAFFQLAIFHLLRRAVLRFYKP
jgi:hypothetical protein